MSVWTIAQGIFFAKAGWWIYKKMALLVGYMFLLSMMIMFCFTYNPTPKEAKTYPLAVQSSLSALDHLRHNFRVILTTIVPVEPSLFKNITKEQIKKLVRPEKAILVSVNNNPIQRISLRNMSHQAQKFQQLMMGKGQIVYKELKEYWNKSKIKKLDWSILKSDKLKLN